MERKPCSHIGTSGGRQFAKFRTTICFFTIWFVLAVFGLYYVGVMSLTVRDVRLHKAGSIEEFELGFKTLYVFSKRRGSVDEASLKPKTFSVLVYGGFTSLPKVRNDTVPDGVDQDMCTNVNTKQGMFVCSELLPSSDNIFFLESSCAASNSHLWMLQPNKTSKAANLSLSEKQACSVYSAAYHNPDRKVILLFTCPVPAGYNWTKEWTALFDLQNFFFGLVNLADLYTNTSLSDFYHGPLSLSQYAVSHQSDILRQYVLYLYGGTYMDLDVISFKSLDGLGINFVIHENDEYITAGVWNFRPNHPFLRQCLLEATLHYDPNSWSTIGPLLFTRTLKSFCQCTSDHLDAKSMINFTACDIRVLPQNTFFSVHWEQWEYLFKCTHWPAVQVMTRNSYGVHYWNHKGNLTLYTGSSQAVVKFAQQHCPPIYQSAGLVFS